ncbi:hypothetical protein NQ315_016758 [Exocentrus adspersus]|uniref:Integrase catalytic domain-containing protein n=1 Tax=Exocentrus adspersus TaxID=1586481 RepID=A0AAV8VCZ0_9CUCU|nr:hypothetical protein NQ315_016758 [Exocentrus adspersus]
MNNLTIPRLELLACTISAKLLNTVLEDITRPNVDVYCWTDSTVLYCTTVLSWIQREDYWKPFIWNRGPDWLKYRDLWPEQNFITNEKEILQEKRSEQSLSFFNVRKGLSSFYSYFSTYIKNLKQMAWIRRFIFNCKCENKNKKLGCLSADEIIEAEVDLLKIAQHASFKEVTDKNIIYLNPLIDEKGIIRIKTRLTERSGKKINLSLSFRNVSCRRQGLMCKLREKFWIINSRRTIKKVIYRVICRRFNTRRVETFPSALPCDRIRDAAVFEVTGFNPPGTAWWGGWWERLIRILKDLLRKQLGRAYLTYEELNSVLCECEAIINSRPLTYVTEDNKDLVPITQSIFLQEIPEVGTLDLSTLDYSRKLMGVTYGGGEKIIFNVSYSKGCSSLRKHFRTNISKN